MEKEEQILICKKLTFLHLKVQSFNLTSVASRQIVDVTNKQTDE